MGLKEGKSYLIKTKGGEIYLGVFQGCERRPFIGSKQQRMVEIFKNACAKTSNSLSHYDYLHLLAYKIRDTVQVDFDKSKFLNTPKTELLRCFDNGHL